VYERHFQKTKFKRVQPLFGTTKPGLEFAQYTIAPTVAFTICESSSLGISIDWQIERFRIRGLQNFDHCHFSLHPGHLTNRSFNYAHGVPAPVGWRTQLLEWLAFGATYQPKTQMSRLHKFRGFLVNGRLDVPEKLGLGIAIYPCPGWVV